MPFPLEIQTNDSTCVICRAPLFPHEDRRTDQRIDKNWGEARCFPHEDPEKLHITLRMLFDCAKNCFGAPRPHSVAQAMAVILYYEYEAPDNAVEAEYIDAAVEFLGDGMGLRLT